MISLDLVWLLFNGIPTFMGYLKPNPSLKNISRTINPKLEDNRLKVHLFEREHNRGLDFEIAYYHFAFHQVNH